MNHDTWAKRTVIVGDESSVSRLATELEGAGELEVVGSLDAAVQMRDETGNVRVVIDADYLYASGFEVSSGRRTRILQETASELLAHEAPEALIQPLAEKAMEHLDCNVFFNFLVDEASGRLHLNAYAGVPDEDARAVEWLDYSTAICGTVAQTAARVVVENAQSSDDPKAQFVRPYGVQAYVCQPLVSHHGRLIGTLSFGTRSKTSFSENDLVFVRAMADQMADALGRRQAEEALKASESNYRAIFDTANDAIFVHDMQTGAILDVNRKMTEMYGYTVEEVRELDVEALSAGEPPFTQSEALRLISVAVNGTPQLFEWKSKDKAGRIFWVEVNLKRASIGGTDRLLAIVRDITERKEYEHIREGLLEREQHISEVLQQALVPREVPTRIGDYQIASVYRAALREAEIGGDFYDIFDLGGGRIGILLGDVVGKGLPAAMQVAAARHTMRAYAFLDPRPGRVMQLANNALCRDDVVDGHELTALFAVLDTNVGIITYANAGHEPPVLMDAEGNISELEVKGLLLSTISGVVYNDTSRRLNPGDRIVMVTDGITEARSKDAGLFGKSGMMSYIEKNPEAYPRQLADGLLDAATKHAGGTLQDDAAIVVVERVRNRGKKS